MQKVVKKYEELRRNLRLKEATCLVVGGIIGVSIFFVPSAVADATGSPLLAISVWVLAGALAAAAAMCFAELGSAIPATGGTYEYLKRAYRSKLLAFCFAWMMCLAYGAAAVAVVALMAANYLAPLIAAVSNARELSVQTLAVSLILIIATLNIAGVRQGGVTQYVLTMLKISILLFLIICPYVYLIPEWSGSDTYIELRRTDPWSIAQGIANGLILCLFAYSGAYFVTHVAEEIEHPEQNIPRAIKVGFTIVFIIYIAINTTFLLFLPYEDLRTSETVAVDLISSIFSNTGSTVVSIAIVLSALAVLNAQLMSYPRVGLAVARDHGIFGWLAAVNVRTRTPYYAIILLASFATMYTTIGGYREILTSVSFVSHAFIMLAVAAVIVLRVREPELVRPYKVWGYPCTPILFLLVSVVYMGLLLINELRGVMTGIIIVLAGVPVYLLACRARNVSGRPAKEH